MRVSRSLNGSVVILGGRFPFATVLVAAVTLLASVAGAVLWRSGVHLLARVGLAPDFVAAGEAWRLLTWSFFDPSALSLIFALLIVLFLGRDLCHSWGAVRFLVFYSGTSVATGLGVCLVGRLGWGDVWRGSYFTAWPVVEAITIAWATMFPSRQILMYFVIPVGGQALVYIAVFGTLVFALLDGFALYVPHFIAMGLAWAYLRGFSLEYYWLRFRVATGLVGRRRPSHLRPVERPDRSEPPRWLH